MYPWAHKISNINENWWTGAPKIMPHDHIIKFGKHEAFRTCIIHIDIYAFTLQKRFQSTVITTVLFFVEPKSSARPRGHPSCCAKGVMTLRPLCCIRWCCNPEAFYTVDICVRNVLTIIVLSFVGGVITLKPYTSQGPPLLLCQSPHLPSSNYRPRDSSLCRLDNSAGCLSLLFSIGIYQENLCSVII